MPRFLHVADVHLGFDRYDNPERTKDFFLAFRDVLERYAIAAQVDFVVIAGDLFEHRHILPVTLNQAQVCLQIVQEAGIPVLAIEGNHDHRPYGTKTSWLRYLTDWGYLMLLEPNEATGSPEDLFQPWDVSTRRGGYVDLACGVRVVGSRWYGAIAPQAVQFLAEGLRTLPTGPAHTVMMFHHGLEGQISRYSGALRYGDLVPLKDAGVDYLALGHIHKHYTVEGWIFNPGSVEANSIAEGQQQITRGVYGVEISQQGTQADLKQDYYQRPIVRLTVEVNKQQTLEQVREGAIATVKGAIKAEKTQAAIVELRLQGQVGFNRADFDVRTLRAELQSMSEAFIFLLKLDVTGTEYQTYLSEDKGLPPRQLIEQHIFTDLLAAYPQYADRATILAEGLGELKHQVLDGKAEDELFKIAQGLLHSEGQAGEIVER